MNCRIMFLVFFSYFLVDKMVKFYFVIIVLIRDMNVVNFY